MELPVLIITGFGRCERHYRDLYRIAGPTLEQSHGGSLMYLFDLQEILNAVKMLRIAIRSVSMNECNYTYTSRSLDSLETVWETELS